MATTVHPFRYITIDSVCMAIFRALNLKNGMIDVVNNIDSNEKYSKISIAWLDYIMKTKGINIQHALNGDEEVLLLEEDWYKVDGFDKASNTVHEFQGCFWHSCPKCHSGATVNTRNQCEMKDLCNRTLIKKNWRRWIQLG